MNGLLGKMRGIFTRRPAAPVAAPVQEDDRLRRTVARLSAGVAHDLNNILLVLQGYAEMAIEEPGSGPGVRALLEEMRTATHRASLLVRDLQVLGDRGSGTPRLIDLTEAVRRFLPALRSECPEGFEIRTALAEGLPRVGADEDLVARVLAALCGRARESMPEGGVIRISTARRGEMGQERVSLEVTDAGAALTDELRSRVFEPYAPGPGGAKGQGLGMSVVQAAARRLGGELLVRSGPGGTTIEMRIPPGGGSAAADSPPEPARPSSAPAPAARPGAQTILVAEDDEGLRALAVKVLTREGYTVLAARDGQEAVELFAREASAVRLALLDDVMPRLGGQAAMDRMRALDPTLPVILCSGYNWRLDAQASESAARCQTLQKPWQPRGLLRKVREGLEQVP